MAVFKCKMCGGTLEFQGKETVAVCEYCGTRQTLPRLDNDRRRNLYDRANHFRRNNEYDRAAGIYEQILSEDQEDAEAYWSLVLCRYGIEYVEDAETHRRVPTVNRTQFASVFSDADYQSALRYADGAQKAVYEAEAKAIDELQKGILEISGKEEPFDVFLCYKETGSDGKRTPDSVLANDLYHQLIQEGFRVFFSRITLEDKLGAAYEPYIFAALNSARVMVALGTKPEYFQAAWVKNEWNRYLALAKRDPKKVLIPAYKDMDPYDLPEEFSHLQAQDMSKLGFMQDLIRGIKKILASDGAKTEEKSAPQEDGPGNAGAAPLLRRAFMFLEDGEWADADEYCEKVLDLEPENARAYLGKLMAELWVRREEALKNQPMPFDQNRNYQKALRFADEELASTLKGYTAYIVDRNERERRERTYQKAVTLIEKNKTRKAYQEAAELFAKIPGYQDADARRLECEEKVKDLVYKSAKGKMIGTFSSTYVDALELFESIPGYQDADELAALCRIKIEELKKEEAERKRRQEEEERAEAKKKKRILIIGATSVCICIVVFSIAHKIYSASITANSYQKAVGFIEAGEYDEAIEIFEGLGEYKDSLDRINRINLQKKYLNAVALLEAKNYDDAYGEFLELGNYKDSLDKIEEIEQIKAEMEQIKAEMEQIELESRYRKAVSLLKPGTYMRAYDEFAELGNYKDSQEKKKQAYFEDKYEYITALIKQKDYEKADEVFIDSETYKDCPEMLDKIEQLKMRGRYEHAMELMEREDFSQACKIFGELGGYADSQEKILQIFQRVSIGDTLSIGANLKYDTDWRVLAKEEDRMLVISERVLSAVIYNEISHGEGTDWKDCAVRKWLNKNFYEGSFNEFEQTYILETSIEESDDGDIRDRIFLLSEKEAEIYFSSDDDRKAQGEYRKLESDWWLRSSDQYVDRDGSFKEIETKKFTKGVRPAMWISLKPENER